MAERRMFAKTIVTSDAFLDMPASARCLYFLLGMLADDDGFVNNPNSVMRQSGATIDDMKLLIAKRFVLTFESGVVVIKHWCIHNTIQKDRYKETKYLEEKSQLILDKNNGYSQDASIQDTHCIQPVSKPEPQVRLGKVSVSKDKEDKECGDGVTTTRRRFTPPTLEEVQMYCRENGYDIDAERFIDYYTSNGWMVGKNKMKDWKAAVRTWARKDRRRPEPGRSSSFLDLAEEL